MITNITFPRPKKECKTYYADQVTSLLEENLNLPNINQSVRLVRVSFVKEETAATPARTNYWPADLVSKFAEAL